MKWVLITGAVIFVSVLLVNQAQGGTLDRGVCTSAFFIGGGANGNPTIDQLKYQMAIDTSIGFKERYTAITYTYSYNYTDNYNSGTFNTFDVVANGEANVTINNNSTY